MSKISIKPFSCPSCGNNGEFKMYESVNVSLNPELREKVLSGQIFDWVCPKCGESLSVRYDLLYHDMNKEFQIYYSPNNCTYINKMINDMLTKYPGMRKLCRTVDSLNTLREKILIFEAGLNDIAIELAKLVMKYDSQNIPESCELRFESILPHGKTPSQSNLVFRQILDGTPQKGFVLFDKNNYDNYLNEVSTNPIYKMKQYCDTIDEKWIVERMA